ncbi:MAG: hypothetical protein HFH81_08450 [Lachnospiraceae bacterium]|nr:hypothetical protein [Lachnospiraceae bacterium]
MWDWAGALCAAVLLGYHGLFDIKRKNIPVKSLFLGVAVSCCWVLGKGLLGQQSWAVLGAGLLPGIVALLLARVTREQLGRGDGWELILMGNWMGLADCLLALGVALAGIFLVSAVLLLIGRANRNTRIAFVPFLWTGTAVVLLQIWIL